MHHKICLVNNMEITKREILFSIIIALVMMILGIFIDSGLQDSIQENLSQYYKALKIESQEPFQYALDTSIGNSLVYGEIVATNPVSFKEYNGEYFYIEKVYEHYTRHTRTVTYTDSSGKTKTKEEEYYTWDVVDREKKISESFNLYGNVFANPLNGLPKDESENFKIDSNDRYYFVFVPKSITGTIEAKIGKDQIFSFNEDSEIQFYFDKTPEEVIASLEDSQILSRLLFWIVWILLTGGCIAVFCYFDNRWLEG